MSNQEWKEAIQAIVEKMKTGLITDDEALAELLALHQTSGHQD